MNVDEGTRHIFLNCSQQDIGLCIVYALRFCNKYAHIFEININGEIYVWARHYAPMRPYRPTTCFIMIYDALNWTTESVRCHPMLSYFNNENYNKIHMKAYKYVACLDSIAKYRINDV